ncbi:phosphate/phosphite/phosphonate ABC transporter substrate-binding protein [Deinococcus sonorensis]|uniref:PhnD/SsuA/transferrin family substrate-binding protein n=2 Tax=Deinococcus sonorensis TaxID=309891 RepID=A0AAU7U7P7_9DEIO
MRLASMLSANAAAMYAALGGVLSTPELPVHFDPHAGLDDVLHGDAPLAAMCGLLYTRHQHALRVLVAPVPRTTPATRSPLYCSQVVVRRRAGPLPLPALRGARWVINERASFSGYVALLAGLRDLGLDASFLGVPQVTGSHLASLQQVVTGAADVTAVDSSVLQLALQQNPALQGALQVVTSFGPYPAPPLVVHRRVPTEQRARWTEALTTLHHSPEGRRVLDLAQVERYVPVTDDDYAPIRAAERRAAPWLDAVYA